MSKDCAVVIYPPYPEYKEAPDDHSASELFDCPKCDKKMWLSEKKKGILLFNSCLDNDIVLACYDCIKKIAEEDPEFFVGSTQVNI